MTIYGAIGAGDLAVLRSANTHAVERYLTVIPPLAMMTARINQASFTYPLGEIAIDNVSFSPGFTLTDVRGGFEVWIGTSAGERDVLVGRIRRVPTPALTPNTLYIEELGGGSTGVPQTHYRELANNQYITVVRTMNVWEMFPRFEDLGGGSFVIRKDWDIAYSDQNTYPNPIANITPTNNNPVGFVDTTTGKYRITLSAANSIAALDGNSIKAYLWDIGGGVLIAGALNGSWVTVDFDAGPDLVFLQVTDANGKTGRANLPVYYHDDATEVPIELTEISSDVRDIKGHRISFKANPNDLPLDDVPHGSLVYIWSIQRYGDSTTEASSDYMMGWAIREEISIDPRFPDISFEVIGPVPLLDQVAAIPQRVERAPGTPTNWQAAIPAYVNVPGMVHYLFYWHYRNLAELCDVRLLTGEAWDITRQPAFGAADLSGVIAGRQFANLASRLPANFGSASDGSIHIVRDPQYLQSRAGVTSRMTLTEDDVISVRAIRQHRLRTSIVRADGFIDNYGGDTGVVPVKSQAPDLIPAQATGRTELRGMVVRSQQELNWLSGAHWAVENQPWEFEIELAPNLNVFEPALMYRVPLEISDAAFNDPVYGETWRRLFDLVGAPGSAQTIYLYIQSVMVSNSGTAQSISIRVVPELTPTPGVTIPILQPVEYPEEVTIIPTPAPPENAAGDFLEAITYAVELSDGVYIMVEAPASGLSSLYILSADNFITDASPKWVQRAQIPRDGAPLITTIRRGVDFQVDPNDRDVAYILADQAQGATRYVYKCNRMTLVSQNWQFQDEIIGGQESSARLLMSNGHDLWLAIPTIWYPGGIGSWAQLLWTISGGWSNDNQEIFYQRNALPRLVGDYGDGLTSADADKFGNGNIIQSYIFWDGAQERYRTATGTTFGTDPWTQNPDEVGTKNAAHCVIVPYETLAGESNINANLAFAAIPTWNNAESVGLMQTTDQGVNWTDETPTVGGDDYGIMQNAGRGFCVSPQTSQRWALCGYPVSGAGGTARALVTRNAGAAWSTVASFVVGLATDRTGYYCCEGWVDSDGNEICAFGGDAYISVSTDWTSFASRAGNLATVLGTADWRVRAIQPAFRGELEL